MLINSMVFMAKQPSGHRAIRPDNLTESALNLINHFEILFGHSALVAHQNFNQLEVEEMV